MDANSKCGFCKWWNPIYDANRPTPMHGYCENPESENYRADIGATLKCVKFAKPTLEDCDI